MSNEIDTLFSHKVEFANLKPENQYRVTHVAGGGTLHSWVEDEKDHAIRTIQNQPYF